MSSGLKNKNMNNDKIVIILLAVGLVALVIYSCYFGPVLTNFP